MIEQKNYDGMRRQNYVKNLLICDEMGTFEREPNENRNRISIAAKSGSFFRRDCNF